MPGSQARPWEERSMTVAGWSIGRGAGSRALARVLALSALLGLAACDPVALGNGPAVGAGGAVTVALLVPSGSGNAADDALARSLENAARLAAADLTGAEITLQVYPTGGNAAGATAAVAQAAEAGAGIILGPVYADEAAAAGVAAAGRGLSVLAFSNNPAVAGRNVFILGNTFQNTANRLTGFARSRGRDRILIVHGQDAAEEIGRDAIRAAAGATGAQVVGEASFPVSQQGVIDAIPSITAQARASGANALFLTSGTAGALPFLAQLLPENGLTPDAYQFIGLQRWDIPASALSVPGLRNGWFALPDPGLTAGFQSRYAASFGGAPHPIAGLAYDGIAAIGALAQSGRADALGPSGLTQGQGFAGVNGIFRFRSDGTNQRGLAVAQIQNGQVVVIDPAPRAFGGPGS
jgi:hypothetical protein